MTNNWRITDRDPEILKFCNRYGLATVEQIRREFFGGSVKAAYRRLQALGDLGLLKAERVFYRGPGVYRVTEAGARMSGVDLPPPRLDIQRIYHTLEVLELSHALRQDAYEEVEEWVTEREIRRDQMAARREGEGGKMRPLGPTGRIPDGIAILGEGSGLGIELELVPKRKANYQRIFDHHHHHIESGELDGVRFYFVSRKAMERAQTIAGHHKLRSRLDFRHYRAVLEHRQ